MTSRGRSLSVNITGDADKLKRELAVAQRAVREAERDLAKMGVTQGGVARSGNDLTAAYSRQGSELSRLRSSYMGYAAALTAGVAATAGAVAVVQSLTNAARDEREALNKSNEVFEQSASTIQRWSETADQAIGLSRMGALDAAGTFGNLFTQLDLGSARAANMSTTMVELAGDFSSFHNADITQVIQAQTAAFRGEYDAVQRFVPIINAAAVQQQGLKMGLASTTSELTAQDKALATYTLLLDGAGKAMGDNARTANDLAGQQRRLDAELDNLRATMGEQLVPVVLEGTTAMNDFIASIDPDHIAAAGAAIRGLTEDVTTLTGEAFNAAAAFTNLITLGGMLGLGDFAGAAGAALNPLGPVTDIAGAGFDWLRANSGANAVDRSTRGNFLRGGVNPTLGEDLRSWDSRTANTDAARRAANARLFPGVFTGDDFDAHQSDLDRLRSQSERAAFERDMARVGDANRRKFAEAAEKEREKAVRGASAGPTSFSGSNLSLIDRALSGTPGAFSGTPSVREFEQAEREFSDARKALNRDLALLGLTMADLDAQGQENTAEFKSMEERADALRDAVKRIDLIEDLQLTPFRDAIAETREAIEAATEAERARSQELTRTMQSIGEQARGDISGAVGMLAAAGVTDPEAYRTVAGQIRAVTVDPAQQAILDAQRLGLIDAGQGMGLLNELRAGLSPKSPLDDLKELLGLNKPGLMGSGIGGGAGHIDRSKAGGFTNYGEINVNTDQVDAESLLRLQDRLAE